MLLFKLNHYQNVRENHEKNRNSPIVYSKQYSKGAYTKAEVYTVADAYLAATHCAVSEDLFVVNEDYPLTENEVDFSSYVVLAEGDNCSGGNATHVTMLIPIQGTLGGLKVDTYVNDLFTYLDHEHINNRFVENFQYNPRNKQLSFITYVFDDGDTNHSPSLKYKVIIDLDKQKVVKTQFLKKIPPYCHYDNDDTYNRNEC